MIEKKHLVYLAVALGLSLILDAAGNSALASIRPMKIRLNLGGGWSRISHGGGELERVRTGSTGYSERSHNVLIMAAEIVMAALPSGEWEFITEYDEHDPLRQADVHVKLYIDPTSIIRGTETSIGKRIFFLALKTYDSPNLLGAVKETISCEAALGEKWLLHFMEVRFYDSQDKEVGTPITDFGAWIEVNPNAPEPNYYKLTAAAAKKTQDLIEEPVRITRN